MFRIRSGFLGLVLAAAASSAAPTLAGTVSVTWDPAPGAAGYYVYYRTQPENYNDTRRVTTTTTSATIGGLQD